MNQGTSIETSNFREEGCVSMQKSQASRGLALIKPGDQFGQLTVIQLAGTGGKVYWLCRCSCGEQVEVSTTSLRAGYKKSCGCLQASQKLQVNAGDRFGEWVLVERRENYRKKQQWLCRCSCEKQTEKVLLLQNLTRGLSKSCGCHKSKVLSWLRKKDNITHGDSRCGHYYLLYLQYRAMLGRCYYAKNASAKYYSQRGISVCDEWQGLGGYEKFKAWAVSNGWKPTLSLDRRENDGNYSPENCRWVTMLVQAGNRRKPEKKVRQ